MVSDIYEPKQIKALREALEMSQYQFGIQLGYNHPQVQVSYIERGSREPDVKTCLLLQHLEEHGPLSLEDED